MKPAPPVTTTFMRLRPRATSPCYGAGPRPQRPSRRRLRSVPVSCPGTMPRREGPGSLPVRLRGRLRASSLRSGPSSRSWWRSSSRSASSPSRRGRPPGRWRCRHRSPLLPTRSAPSPRRSPAARWRCPRPSTPAAAATSDRRSRASCARCPTARGSTSRRTPATSSAVPSGIGDRHHLVLDGHGTTIRMADAGWTQALVAVRPLRRLVTSPSATSAWWAPAPRRACSSTATSSRWPSTSTSPGASRSTASPSAPSTATR